jgi:hypothetical protein
MSDKKSLPPSRDTPVGSSRPRPAPQTPLSLDSLSLRPPTAFRPRGGEHAATIHRDPRRRQPAPNNAPQRPNNARPAEAKEEAPRVLHFPRWVVDDARKHGVDYGQLRATAESQYSCLMPYQMDQVAAIYAAEVEAPPATILDATANVGCDTIQLSRMYPGAAITSVEIDPETAALLRFNMAHLADVLGRKVDRPVATVGGDCVELLAGGHQADLVYFDIPWGGPEYYKAPSMRLALNGRPLGDIVGMVLTHNAPLVVVKAPVNADMKEFMGAVGNHAKHGADYRSHDVVKPKGNSKGAIAYRLVFVRALPPPLPPLPPSLPDALPDALPPSLPDALPPSLPDALPSSLPATALPVTALPATALPATGDSREDPEARDPLPTGAKTG